MTPKVVPLAFVSLVMLAGGCARQEKQAAPEPTASVAPIAPPSLPASAATTPAPGEVPMKLSSPAFSNEGAIPKQYTCEGTDKSPPLLFSDVPANTKSLALIVSDPDAPDPAAPKRTWVHWVAYNLPPTTRELAEGTKTLGDGAREGKNDWGKPGYRGPCPPIGRHRYFHKLYALDTVLPDLGQPTKADLEQAMTGHTLATAELMGTYQKGK